MVMSGPMMISSLKQSHDVLRDSSSSCLKFRTSFRRLTTLELGKKRKQNLEHSISQSPCILSTVRLYNCLALPVKENGNNFHLKVLSDMPAIRKHAQICSNSHRCEYGFSSLSLEKDLSWINFIKLRHSSKPGGMIGSEDYSGFRYLGHLSIFSQLLFLYLPFFMNNFCIAPCLFSITKL